MEDKKMLKEAEAEKENQEPNLPEGDDGQVPAVVPTKSKKQLKLEKDAQKKARASHKADLKVWVEANPDDQEAATELALMQSEDTKAAGKTALKIVGIIMGAGTALYTGYKIVTGKGGKDSDSPVADVSFTEVPNNGTPEK